jgi:type I restriction enzyme S subunit
MYSQLMVGKKLIQKASTNSMKGMVSKGKFELIPVMVPPMDMQLQFSRIFCKQMKMVQNMELHSEQGERSFSALAQELFSGRIN